jgi:hypothetical protein
MKPLLKSIHWSLLVVPLAVTLGLAAIGCADLSSTEGTSGIDGATTSGSLPGETTTEVVATATTVASPTTTSGSSTAVSHTPSTNTASESVTTDGHVKACGRITDVWSKDGARKLTIDYVDYLTGAAADAAAVAEGESSAPGGYGVRNKSTKLPTRCRSPPTAGTVTSAPWTSRAPGPISTTSGTTADRRRLMTSTSPTGSGFGG